MKKNWVKKIDFLKEYLSVILLVPTLLGGFWQLIELSSISTAYIRFFSITQVIPDGLLILFIISCIIGSLYLSKHLIKWSPFAKSKNNTWKSTIIIMTLLSIAYIIMGFEVYYGIIEYGFLRISDIILIIIMGSFYIGAFALLLPESFLKKLKTKDENEKSLEEKSVKKEDDVPEWKTLLTGLLALGILVLIFRIFIYFLLIIGALRKSFIETENLVNIENLKKEINKSNVDREFKEIIYFNDKYLFIDLRDSTNTKYIKIYKTEKIFDITAGNNGYHK